jgi:hypothetical protein
MLARRRSKRLYPNGSPSFGNRNGDVGVEWSPLTNLRILRFFFFPVPVSAAFASSAVSTSASASTSTSDSSSCSVSGNRPPECPVVGELVADCSDVAFDGFGDCRPALDVKDLSFDMMEALFDLPGESGPSQDPLREWETGNSGGSNLANCTLRLPPAEGESAEPCNSSGPCAASSGVSTSIVCGIGAELPVPGDREPGDTANVGSDAAAFPRLPLGLVSIK